MEDKMTVFYSKTNGKIVSLCTGEQNMNFFGDNSSDMSLIWDYIIIDYSQDLFSAYKSYKVNLISKEIVHI